ncbi:hypothetical protein ACVOMT_13780 [Sphingomonas panni]
MRGPLTLRIVAALVPVLTSIATVNAAPRPAVLEATTRADWRAAGLDGTGCYWSPRRGGPIVFVAAGDKAMTRVGGASSSSNRDAMRAIYSRSLTTPGSPAT